MDAYVYNKRGLHAAAICLATPHRSSPTIDVPLPPTLLGHYAHSPSFPPSHLPSQHRSPLPPTPSLPSLARIHSRSKPLGHIPRVSVRELKKMRRGCGDRHLPHIPLDGGLLKWVDQRQLAGLGSEKSVDLLVPRDVLRVHEIRVVDDDALSTHSGHLFTQFADEGHVGSDKRAPPGRAEGGGWWCSKR